MNLPVSGALTDGGKLKQLKTMTSPLSKLAKGMHNIGLNLDPRKIAAKTGVLSPTTSPADTTPPERSASNREQLMELWDVYQCKTKLIAL